MAMNLPGFTAEASLYLTHRPYATAARPAAARGAVVPQLSRPGAAFLPVSTCDFLCALCGPSNLLACVACAICQTLDDVFGVQ